MTDQETTLPSLFPPLYKLLFLNQIPAMQVHELLWHHKQADILLTVVCQEWGETH